MLLRGFLWPTLALCCEMLEKRDGEFVSLLISPKLQVPDLLCNFLMYLFKNYSEPILTNSCQIGLAVLVWFISSHQCVQKLPVIKFKGGGGSLPSYIGAYPNSKRRLGMFAPTVKLITYRNFDA